MQPSSQVLEVHAGTCNCTGKMPFESSEHPVCSISWPAPAVRYAAGNPKHDGLSLWTKFRFTAQQLSA